MRKKGLYSGKYALYHPTALNLFRHITFLFVKKTEHFAKVEAALREHPYTTHRSRIYAPKLGVYAEFNFLKRDPELLLAFFEELKKHNLLTNFQLFSSKHKQKLLSLNLKKISIEDFQWNFNWETFQKRLGKVKAKPLPQPAKNVLPELKVLDLKILRILKNDADISQRALSRKLAVDRTEVWRRIHFLEENVIATYKSKIDQKNFNITSNKILILTFDRESDLRHFFTAFSDEEIRPPFRYRFEVLEDKKLLMYISLPQFHEA